MPPPYGGHNNKLSNSSALVQKGWCTCNKKRHAVKRDGSCRYLSNQNCHGVIRTTQCCTVLYRISHCPNTQLERPPNTTVIAQTKCFNSLRDNRWPTISVIYSTVKGNKQWCVCVCREGGGRRRSASLYKKSYQSRLYTAQTVATNVQ